MSQTMDALSANALALGLIVPNTIQSVSGYQVSASGCVPAAELMLLEVLARKCKNEPPRVYRTGGQNAYTRLKGLAVATGELAASTGERVKSTGVAIGSAGGQIRAVGGHIKTAGSNISGGVGYAAQGVGRIGSGVYHGVASLGRGVMRAPTAIKNQIVHDARLTKDLVASALGRDGNSQLQRAKQDFAERLDDAASHHVAESPATTELHVTGDGTAVTDAGFEAGVNDALA